MSHSKVEKLNKANPAQLATGGRPTVAQPQTPGQDPIWLSYSPTCNTWTRGQQTFHKDAPDANSHFDQSMRHQCFNTKCCLARAISLVCQTLPVLQHWSLSVLGSGGEGSGDLGPFHMNVRWNFNTVNRIAEYTIRVVWSCEHGHLTLYSLCQSRNRQLQAINQF